MNSDQSHYAAIDVGSNAARLKVARVVSGRLEVVHAARHPLPAGAGELVFAEGRIGATLAAHLGETLAQLGHVCRCHGAALRAVGTSVLRAARNRAEVVAALARASGVTLEVISSADEARLMCLGVRGDAAGTDERALCIDVGGGSTEVVLARGAVPERVWTLDEGALRLADRCGDDLRLLRSVAADAVAGLGDTHGLGHDPVAIGCSGSARALVAFATERARPWATVHELAGAADELARMRPERRQRFFSPVRARSILAAAALLETVMRRFDLYAVRSSKRGVRDGILVELSRVCATDGVMRVAPV